MDNGKPLPGSRLVILAGQSNVVGRGCHDEVPDTLTERLRTGASRLLFDCVAPGGFIARSGSWQPLDGPQLPLQPEVAREAANPEGSCGATCEQLPSFFGPELSLADALTRNAGDGCMGTPASMHSERPLYVAKFAVGSSSIKLWDPDPDPPKAPPAPGTPEHIYPRFAAFCAHALASAPQPCTCIGVCWMQGESDSSAAKSAREHRRRLAGMVRRLRDDLGCEVPFVAQQVLWPRKHTGVVNQGIADACGGCGSKRQEPEGAMPGGGVLGQDVVPAARWSSASGLQARGSGDDHLDGRSLLVVGERMAAALVLLHRQLEKTDALPVVSTPAAPRLGAPPALSLPLAASGMSKDELLAAASRTLLTPTRSSFGSSGDWALWSESHLQRDAAVEVVVGRHAVRQMRRRSASGESAIAVASWNILSQAWMATGGYESAPAEVRDWEKRRGAILSWLDALDADVMCLQEVDYDFFSDTLFPHMQARGFEGAIQQRKSAGKAKEHPNGNATFWRPELLTVVPHLVKSTSRTLVTPFVLAAAVRAEAGQPTPEVEPDLVVVNMHLEANQSKGLERAKQFHTPLEYARRVAPRAALVAVGDNNTGGSCPMHQMLRSVPWCGYRLANAYEHPAAAATTAATLGTFARPFIRYRIDHAFYTPDTLRLCALFEPLDAGELADSFGGHPTRGLPDSIVPSDHTPICASFFLSGHRAAAGGPEGNQLPPETAARLDAALRAFADREPRRPKGVPSEVELRALRAHTADVKAWQATLSADELAYAKRRRKQLMRKMWAKATGQS